MAFYDWVGIIGKETQDPFIGLLLDEVGKASTNSSSTFWQVGARKPLFFAAISHH